MTLIIKGKVQKVGFRYSVVDFVLSHDLKIFGHIKNLPDGSVEVVAQGDLESLKDLHRFCTTGPAHAQVREISQEITPISCFEFSDFSVLSD